MITSRLGILLKHISSCACALSRFSHAWLFATPWPVACQVPLSRGFFRQECWSGLPCHPPEDLPHLEIEPASPEAPALQVASWPLHYRCPRLYRATLRPRPIPGAAGSPRAVLILATADAEHASARYKLCTPGQVTHLLWFLKCSTRLDPGYHVHQLG